MASIDTEPMAEPPTTEPSAGPTSTAEPTGTTEPTTDPEEAAWCKKFRRS